MSRLGWAVHDDARGGASRKASQAELEGSEDLNAKSSNCECLEDPGNRIAFGGEVRLRLPRIPALELACERCCVLREPVVVHYMQRSSEAACELDGTGAGELQIAGRVETSTPLDEGLLRDSRHRPARLGSNLFW